MQYADAKSRALVEVDFETIKDFITNFGGSLNTERRESLLSRRLMSNWNAQKTMKIIVFHTNEQSLMNRKYKLGVALCGE